jgi:Major Facilitator Superfamily
MLAAPEWVKVSTESCLNPNPPMPRQTVHESSLSRMLRMSITPRLPPVRLGIGWLTMFLVGTELFVFSPLLPALSGTLSISATQAGLSVTTFALTYMVTAPVLGWIADWIGRRRILIGSLLAFAQRTCSQRRWRAFPHCSSSDHLQGRLHRVSRQPSMP